MSAPQAVAFFAEHLQTKVQRWREALQHSELNSVLIASGTPYYAWRDDVPGWFRPTVYFKELAPFLNASGAYIYISDNDVRLYKNATEPDIWHGTSTTFDKAWLNAFDSGNSVGNMPNADIFVGPANDPHYHSTNKHRLDTLLAYSDYYSAYNTSFEQYCLYEANRAAIPGHIAAEKAFRSSGSEQEILFSFLQASNQLETLTPYPSVVTLNENAAVLHHQNLNTVRPKNHCSLLIDAGAQYCGYAADITRTYSAMAHGQLFNELLNAMDSLQQQLISEIRAGMSYLTLHERCHEKLAALLIESGICCCSVQETLDTGISRMFFPHGLGHLIGAQVHGQGGHFLDANGAQRKLEENNQYLRLSRKIEDTMAFTVEPGVYFIPQLLEPFRAKIALNWRLIDELYPCGGIRIEDTVLIQQGKAINITRKAFAEN